MKIKALRSLGSGWPAIQEGETGDVTSEIGERLITLGLAVQVTDDIPATLKAVPAVAEFNTAPATDDMPIHSAESTAGLSGTTVELEPTEENTAPAESPTGKTKRR